MQAPPGSQRRQQRSEPASNGDGAPSYASSATTANGASYSARASSASGKSSSRRKDPATQLSQIEKSVTHLLVATKQLLETLTQWSRNQASEGEVSDVYVRLGYEFNIACRAFTSIGVPVDDLGPVPDLLRAILEETLSQEASPQSLDRFLPKIRDIIINLLQGLKRKQSRLRAARGKDGSGSSQDVDKGPSQPQRQPSSGYPESEETTSDKGLEADSQHRSSARSNDQSTSNGRGFDEPRVPQRTSSVPGSGLSATHDEPQSSGQNSSSRSQPKERRGTPAAEPDSPAAPTQQSLPVVQSEAYSGPLQRISLHEETPAPPPPPKQDAIAALQRGGELERRASRRYSAYQISKHLGASPGGVPMIPPPQHSPIPNRGRDVRESLNAVRTRSSLVPMQPRQQISKDTSPARTELTSKATDSNRASVGGASLSDEPSSKTPDSRLSSAQTDLQQDEKLAMSGTANGPVDAFSYDAAVVMSQAITSEAKSARISGVKPVTQSSTDLGPQFVPEISPQPGKELTLFLQYKHRIKKIVLPDGANDLSIPRLQLAFIEKFAWNTHNNGVDLPEIYIQDSVSGVRHELDDLSDIKDRSVLVLNVEPLDEIKRHIDDNFGSIRRVVEGMRTTLDGQQLTLTQVSDRQQDSAKEITRLAAVPLTPRNNSITSGGPLRSPVVAESAVRDIQTLRRDLAIMRQTLSSFSSNVHSSMAAIRSKADLVKAKAVDVAIPVFEADGGRAYVNNGKKSLSDDSDTLVNKVDDLQDVVEDLRKDVVTRGVRPLPRQLEAATKDISDATRELKKMQEFVRREKPIWTKIWEKELEIVCNDREFLTMQEDLIADLDDDLEKATQTMALVEQATKQQNVQSSSTGNLPALRHVPTIDTADVDPHKAKDGVLGQVRALQPNHESRIEAIERAEKARLRELDSRYRDAAFKKELGQFVEDGKLKKSGGFEETDRIRRQKDERAMRDEFDDQQKRKAERAKARAEERARLAAAAQSSTTVKKQEEPAREELAEDDLQDAQDGSEDASHGKPDEQSEGPTSPSGRRSWLPSFMSGSSAG